MNAPFLVRRATLADVPVLARHRAEMFRDIHGIADEQREAMADASRRYFESALPSGEYLAWLAKLIMEHVIAGARDAGVSHLVLHASSEGRPLYEALGFVATNEMRYTGEL